MVIGILTLELHVRESTSLKSKRRVLKSIVDRVRNRFNVSIAEVGGQEHWQLATLGLAFVTTDSAHAHRVLQGIVQFVEGHRHADLTDYSIEIV